MKIESHLNRVRWYWQETEVPTGKGQRNVKIESHLNRVRWFWHEEKDEEDYIVLDVPNVRLKEEEVKRVGMTKPNKVLRPL